ncbi:hypothetical protein [Leifsonia sp. LS-T14]
MQSSRVQDGGAHLLRERSVIAGQEGRSYLVKNLIREKTSQSGRDEL